MIRRRARNAGILTKTENHSFRATGITAYLKNGAKLEIAPSGSRRMSRRAPQGFTTGAMTM